MSRARTRAARASLPTNRAIDEAGRKAYAEGEPLHLNPYPNDPASASAWAGGWMAAFMERPDAGNPTCERRRE